MAVKKSYNRYFIIFQEEDKGYGVAIDKQPTGYTKIENRSGKCKVTVYAQNLVREKGPYYCCLVDSTKDPLVMAKLGAVNIDDTGRGETWWEFREDDIAGTGVPFDRFNVAAVITGDNKIYAPLAGYIGKDKVSWKDRIPYVQRVEEEPAAIENPVNEEPVVEGEQKELDEEAKKFKEYEENIKADADNGGERWKKEKENKEESKEEKKENPKGESKSKDDNKDDNKKENKEEAKSKGNENKKDNPKSEGEKSDGKKDNPRDPDGKGNENKKDNPKSEGEKADGKKDNPRDPDGKGNENKKDNPKDEVKKASEDKPKEESKGNPKDVGKADPKDGAKDNPKETEKAALKPENYPGVIEPFNYDEDIEAKEVSGYLEDNFNKNLDREGDKDKRPFATMFHDILEDFDEEDAPSDEFRDTRWWKIPLSDELPISENIYYPYYCAIYHLKMTYPYINYVKYFKDTGHYHFGMKYDSSGEVKYVLYGIEGNNSPSFQPYMGMTGFIRWIKMKGRDKGLWIMYYNPHTGCIMIPKKR